MNFRVLHELTRAYLVAREAGQADAVTASRARVDNLLSVNPARAIPTTSRVPLGSRLLPHSAGMNPAARSGVTEADLTNAKRGPEAPVRCASLRSVAPS